MLSKVKVGEEILEVKGIKSLLHALRTNSKTPERSVLKIN